CCRQGSARGVRRLIDAAGRPRRGADREILALGPSSVSARPPDSAHRERVLRAWRTGTARWRGLARVDEGLGPSRPMALAVSGASSYASSMPKTADVRPAHGAVRGPAALLTVMVLVTLLALLPDGARAAPPQGAGELEKQDVEAWLDGMLPALLEREAIPGASVSVVHDGEVLTERGYGFADLGTDST